MHVPWPSVKPSRWPIPCPGAALVSRARRRAGCDRSVDQDVSRNPTGRPEILRPGCTLPQAVGTGSVAVPQMGGAGESADRNLHAGSGAAGRRTACHPKRSGMPVPAPGREEAESVLPRPEQFRYGHRRAGAEQDGSRKFSDTIRPIGSLTARASLMPRWLTQAKTSGHSSRVSGRTTEIQHRD